MLFEIHTKKPHGGIAAGARPGRRTISPKGPFRDTQNVYRKFLLQQRRRHTEIVK